MAEPDVRAEWRGSCVLAKPGSSGVLFVPPLPLDAFCGLGFCLFLSICRQEFLL